MKMSLYLILSGANMDLLDFNPLNFLCYIYKFELLLLYINLIFISLANSFHWEDYKGHNFFFF